MPMPLATTNGADCSITYTKSPRLESHLVPLVEEDVPDKKVCLGRKSVHKDSEEPVKGEEGQVHLVALQVRVEARKLLHHQIL